MAALSVFHQDVRATGTLRGFVLEALGLLKEEALAASQSDAQKVSNGAATYHNDNCRRLASKDKTGVAILR